MAIPMPPVTNRRSKKKKDPLLQALVPKPPFPPVTHKEQTPKRVVHEILSGKKIPTYQSNELQKTVPTRKELDAITGKKTPTGRQGNPSALGGNPGGLPVGSSNQQIAQRIKGRKKGGEQFVAGDTSKDKSASSDKGGKHPLLRRAKETIAAQMNPQLAEYRQEIQDTRTSSKQQNADLEDLYRRLGIQLGANKAQGDNANAEALKKIQDNYKSLSGGIDSTYAKATSDTNAELSRLGISEVSPAATTQTRLDHDYLSKLTSIDKTNAEANSTVKSQSFDNLLSTIQGQAGLAGAQDRSRVLREAAKSVADLRSKRGALAATRRGAVDALYHQLKDAKSQREADAAQQNFMNTIAAGKLGIEQGNLGVAQGKLALDQINSVTERDLRRAQAAKDILYVKNGGTLTSKQIKGYNAGLGLLQGMQTGHNAAAKNLRGDALEIYKNVFANYGPDAYRTLTTAGQGTNKSLSELASGFSKLPREGKIAVLDALKAASK
jgi:hypothetical protein